MFSSEAPANAALHFEQGKGDAPARVMATLGDLASYSVERHRDGENVVFVDNLVAGCGGVRFSPEQTRAESALKQYRVGDILVGNIRPYLRKIWQADSPGGASPDVLVIRPGEGVDPGFLYEHLATERFFNHMMANARGSKMPRGDKSSIMDFTIMIPSLTEQQKIAGFLALLEARIAAEEEKVASLRLEKRAFAQRLLY